jgi:hypothetical protein
MIDAFLPGELAIEAAAEAAQEAWLDASEAAAAARLAARRARRVALKARPIAAAQMRAGGASVADIAARLGCSKQWAAELVKRGQVLIADAAA